QRDREGGLGGAPRRGQDGADRGVGGDALQAHRVLAPAAVDGVDQVAGGQPESPRHVPRLLGLERETSALDRVGTDVEAAEGHSRRRARLAQPSTISRSCGTSPAAASAPATAPASWSRIPPRLSVPPGLRSRRYRAPRARCAVASRLARTSGKLPVTSSAASATAHRTRSATPFRAALAM